MLTWDEVTSIDDLVPKNELPILRDLEETSSTGVCPYLRRLGSSFYHCGVGIAQGVTPRLEPMDPIVLARQSSTELQLWCLERDAYRNCSRYPKQNQQPGIGQAPE